MITAFCIGQAVLAVLLLACILFLLREWRERLREREEHRVLQLTIRSLGAAWEEVEIGKAGIDEFCRLARRTHLSVVQARQAQSEPVH